MMHNKKHFN